MIEIAASEEGHMLLYKGIGASEHQFVGGFVLRSCWVEMCILKSARCGGTGKQKEKDLTGCGGCGGGGGTARR